LRKIISDWELSTNARIALSDKRKLSSSLIDCEQKLNNLALAIPHYISGIKYEQEHLRKMQASLSEKTSFLDSQKEFEKMFEKRHVIVDQLSQLKGNKLKIKTLTNELHAITQSRGEKNLTIKVKMEELSGYEQKIAEADTQIKQLDAQLKGMDHDSLLLSQKIIQEKLSILKEAFFLHQNLLNYRKEYDSQKEILEKNRSEQEKSLLSVKSMSLLLKESEEKMNEKKRLYETMLVSIGDIARQLRHKLSQGDKCPVCGQTVHQIVSDEEFEAVLNPLKSDFLQTEEAYKKQQQDWLALNASIAEKKKTIEQMEKELSDFPSKLEENENMLLNRLSQLSIQDIKENLAEELNCLQSAQLKIQKENEEKINSFSMLQKAKDDSEKNFKMILGEFQKGQSLLNKLKDESSQIDQNLAALTSLLETTQNEVLKLVNRLSEEILWDDWHKEIDHTEERLKREADHFSQTQKDAQKLSVEIEKGNEYLSRLTNTMDKLINDEIFYDSCPAIMMND
jgi:exonuclease SbcC